MYISFNRPYLCGKEFTYIQDAIERGKISGNGHYTKLCHQYFTNHYNLKKCLLTSSCTDALEMSAILLNIQPGDEVIMPSYTFVSTANAFILRGAKIIFADSMQSMPNMDLNSLEDLITPKTKAIVVVHYAGIANDMDRIMKIALDNNIYVIEDAAQCVDSFYKNKALGSIGHLGAFSFHETKNIICGEGGLLSINDDQFTDRSEVIWEKGTNRAAFFRGEVDKYGWVDLGSSFLPSEVVSAFLYAQLENLKAIQKKRIELWDKYYEVLERLEARELAVLPRIPEYATNNAHMFYLITPTGAVRDSLIEHLKKNNVNAVFHYQSLHKSPYFNDKHDGRVLSSADHFSDCLIRLPLYFDLTLEQTTYIANSILDFYKLK